MTEGFRASARAIAARADGVDRRAFSPSAAEVCRAFSALAAEGLRAFSGLPSAGCFSLLLRVVASEALLRAVDTEAVAALPVAAALAFAA